MKKPAFQFYVGDWQRNPNLRRCSFSEKGIWVDIMCIMHDQQEYGVLRWPLKEVARAVGCKMSDLNSLITKGVLKGADIGQSCNQFIYRPRHGRKWGDPVILIQEQQGPVWYSSRMVKDEYVRNNKAAPHEAPKPPIGDGSGVGPSTSSSSSGINTGTPSAEEEPYFNIFRKCVPQAMTNELVLAEVKKFRGKYPDVPANKSGPLINTWAGRMNSEPEKPAHLNPKKNKNAFM